MTKKTKNFSKPSAESVTASERRPFMEVLRSVRLGIVVFCLLTVVLIFFGTGYYFDTLISSYMDNWISPKLQPLDRVELEELVKDATLAMWIIRLAAAGFVGLLSYWLTGFFLRPIRRILENQGRFMKDLSHELRTPLSVIKTGSEAALIDPKNLSKEEAIQVIRDNLREVDRITDTLRTIQTISGYQNRIEKMELKEMDLHKAAGEVLETIRPLAKDKKNLKISLTGRPAFIKGNETALEQLMLNLIKNAVTYTEKGSVNVHIEEEGNFVCLSVKDTGIGIPEDEKPYIFEPMFRGTGAKMIKERRGSGLGLALVKEIARVHNANIKVDSEPGKGSTFTVSFNKLRR